MGYYLQEIGIHRKMFENINLLRFLVQFVDLDVIKDFVNLYMNSCGTMLNKFLYVLLGLNRMTIFCFLRKS